MLEDGRTLSSKQRSGKSHVATRWAMATICGQVSNTSATARAMLLSPSSWSWFRGEGSGKLCREDSGCRAVRFLPTVSGRGKAGRSVVKCERARFSSFS